MGLPGAGKTMLAGALKKYLEEHGEISYGRALNEHISSLNATVNWFNADDIRRKYNDWDFSNDGRIRQSLRMFQFSMEAGGDYVICDFVAPLVEMRNNFKADWTVWVDTIREGRYADTNAAFVEPEHYDFRVNEQNAEKWAEFIGQHIIDNRRRPVFDWKKETVQMMGRWQPWHSGHRWLIDQRLNEGKNVLICIRDISPNEKNPWSAIEVMGNLYQELADLIGEGRVKVIIIPDVESVNFGRGVGYDIIEHMPSQEVSEISATKIREQLKQEGKL
jgi:hypothetical protein